MLKDKKRKRQKEETESPKKKSKLSESPATIVNKKSFKAKKNKNLPSLNLGDISSPSNFEPKEKKKRFKPKNANAKNEGANSSSAEPAAQENFSKLFADFNSNKSKKRKFNAESPSKVRKPSPPKQKIEVEKSTDVENFVSKKKKAKAKSPLKKKYGGSKMPPVKQAVEESPKKFSNDKKSTEFKKKKNKVKGESLSTVDSSKEVIGEKKVLNSEKPIKKKKKSKEFVDKNLDKTLFVGNLPADITRKGLEKLFDKLGPVVESVRLRGAIPVNIRIPKKVAEIKHKFHESLHSRKGYVVFKTHEAAKAALSLNGTYVLGHHIIVDKAAKSGEKKTYDNSRSIFVGNLPFDVDDEQMWSAFSGCGEVEAVRVIRDSETGAGKGFGYVLFTDKSGKQAALSQDKLEVEGRIVRIKPVEGKQGNPRKNNNARNFARRQAMKTKKTGDTPQSRKSSKKLIKKHQADKQKKHIAQAFKKFL